MRSVSWILRNEVWPKLVYRVLTESCIQDTVVTVKLVNEVVLMAVYKGGRGNRVPYATQMMRVPTPIKDQIQQFIDSYRASVSEGFTDAPGETTELPEAKPKPRLSKEEAIEKAQQIITHKESARISMSKLLSAIYQEKIKL